MAAKPTRSVLTAQPSSARRQVERVRTFLPAGYVASQRPAGAGSVKTFNPATPQ